jgi:AcrR family transcriptional regulator
MQHVTESEVVSPRVRMSAGQRRESILAAATEVFAEVGYRRGKVSTIAARIGVSEPVVFQNFGTKAALFAAVLDRVATTACDALSSSATRGGSVSEVLAMILSPGHLDEIHAPGAFGALFAEAGSLTSDPGVGEAARSTIRRVATALTELLARGQEASEVRADVDPVAGAWWLLSLVSARTFRTAIAEDPSAVEAQLVALTLALLTVPGGARGTGSPHA